jgi:hypothetical protein
MLLSVPGDSFSKPSHLQRLSKACATRLLFRNKGARPVQWSRARCLIQTQVPRHHRWPNCRSEWSYKAENIHGHSIMADLRPSGFCMDRARAKESVTGRNGSGLISVAVSPVDSQAAVLQFIVAVQLTTRQHKTQYRGQRPGQTGCVNSRLPSACGRMAQLLCFFSRTS